MRKSYLFILPCLTLFPIAFFGCGTTPNFWVEAKPNQKKILVSFAPLYAITHAVAGEDAYVLSMLTAQGPHDYEGTSTDLIKVKNADLFIFNGLTLDDQYVDRIERNHTRNSPLVNLNVGEVMEKKHHDLLLHGGQEHDHGDGVMHKHGEHDPHLWLGPPQAIAMTRIIAAKLAEIDPAHEKGYQARADKFIDELKKLEADGKAAFKDKKNKKIITMHEAFGYFADAFGLDIVEAIQKKPGMDPDAVSVSKLIAVCRQKDGPRVIAVEPQYSKAQAEALQRTLKDDGIQVTIVTLDPLETADIPKESKFNPDPGYYLKEMRKNIETLAKALP